MQADQAVLRVVEVIRDGADHLEPQRFPQAYRRGVGLHDRVEPDPAEAWG